MNKTYFYLFFLLAITLLFVNCIKNTENISVEMVKVESGEFVRTENSRENNKIIKAFYIGKYEITFCEYDIFCGETKRTKVYDRGWGRRNRPVINTCFHDNAEFCNWLSRKENLKECYKKILINNRSIWTCDLNANGYRLPTEDEWEYAAKGGNKSMGYKYSGSNNIRDVAWYNFNSDNFSHEKGLKKPNELGIYDMSGNVYERCWVETEGGNLNKGDKTVKGGSFNSKENACEITYILHVNSGFSANNTGFRIARNCE